MSFSVMPPHPPRSTRLMTGLMSCALLLGLCAGQAQAQTGPSERVKALLGQMTLEEKAGQLNLQAGHDGSRDTGVNPRIEQAVREGKVGGVLNIAGAKKIRDLQEIAITQTRLKIPLLIGLDVVHGYRTMFPVPIGQAASFNLDLIRKADEIAALEATASGINWTFAPVLDLGRDPRWGRIVETAGESPWYAAAVAKVRVEAFQGRSLSDASSMLACAKHFVGNGATEGGREYSAVNLSLRSLRENELKPFEAAIAAKIGCVMPAFNAVDGIPGILNHRVLRYILRKEWQFNGLTVTDHGAIAELPMHGVARDLNDAAAQALKAGVDMDMASQGFGPTLPQAVRQGLVDEALIDQAVLRVLDAKERLGLFDQPHLRNDSLREQALVGHPDHARVALKLAEESLVLLKNEGGLLPLSASYRSVAILGPFAGDGHHLMGPWDAKGVHDESVSLHDGLTRLNPRLAIKRVVTGYTKPEAEALNRAIAAARKADLVILTLGERVIDSGESASRADPGLTEPQRALLKAVAQLKKPFVVMITAGRGLVDPLLYKSAPAIVHAWFPGTRGGEAMARLLYGVIEPVGRLPITIARSVGQLPLNHDKPPTGRPHNGPPKVWSTGYIDEMTTPLFPFGFGLSYTQFAYDKPVIVSANAETVDVAVTVRNTGNRTGTTLVQLYAKPNVALISQPEKQFRGFTHLTLKAGEEGTVRLTLNRADLSYWISNSEKRTAIGPITIMTGPDAGQTQDVVWE